MTSSDDELEDDDGIGVGSFTGGGGVGVRGLFWVKCVEVLLYLRSLNRNKI